MNMKSVIAIAVMIACRAAFAWAHCDIPMLSFCLPHKQETQLMQKMVEQIRDKSDRLSDRFKCMTDSAATRAICDRLGVSNEFMRVEEDASSARAQLVKLMQDLHKLESASDSWVMLKGETDALRIWVCAGAYSLSSFCGDQEETESGVEYQLAVRRSVQ